MPSNKRSNARLRPPYYWRSYHSGNASLWRIIKLVEAVVLELGSPWELSTRGRPPKFLPEQHALYCILAAFMGWTLRQAEACLALLGVSIDHSTVGKAMQRLPESYLEQGIVLLNFRISRLLGRSGIYAADSTGIACDRSKRKVIRALRVIEVEEHVKLHAIVELRPGLASIAGARVTEGEAHDAPLAEEMLSRGELGEGILLADSAYDSEQIFKACFEKGLTPVVKPRKNSRKGRFRRRARECFYSEVYRFRGVAEGVFGAIELKYKARIRARKRKTKAIAALLLALSYNLSAAMRAISTAFELALKRNVHVLVEFVDNPACFERFIYSLPMNTTC